jgi:predicted PurR-regulated permease PerM
MMDLDPMKARIQHACPPQHREWARGMSARVGQVFAAYLRGLTLICLAFGLVNYLVLGGMFQLQYAVILGLLAVVLYAIPYLGQLTLLAAAVLIAWLSGRPPAYTIGVAVAVLVVGQLFDQVVTPRVMGKQVGLHPVLGVFALMVGGQLFGLIGMVLAVPVAAAIRVVLIEFFPRLGEPLSTPEERRSEGVVPVAEAPPEAELPAG